MARKRIGIFVYFQPSVGGGERYLLTMASILRQHGDVDFICPREVDLAPLAERFGLDLEGVRSVRSPWVRFHGLRDWFARGDYDLFIALDNHLAPMRLSLGRRGVLILQTPPYEPPFHAPLRSRLKLRTYSEVVVYSEYTRGWALRHGAQGRPINVIAPPVETKLYTPRPKRKWILSVGRFFVGRHHKNHETMIETFRGLCDTSLAGWELHLAGSVREYRDGDPEYLERLRALAAGAPIHFHVNAPLDEMRSLYGESSIYWHATGFGVDENTEPQKLEHFGMSIVEAMAAGAIPIVYGAGGPLEIVEDGVTGHLWRTRDELAALTVAATQSDLETIRDRAVQAADRFSKERFAEAVHALAERHLTL